MTTDFLHEARLTYDSATDIEDDGVRASYLLEAQAAALVSIAESLAGRDVPSPAIKDVLSNMSTLLTTLAQRIEIVEWRQSGQAEQMAAMIARRSEADKRIAELAAQVETLTAVVEDLAGFDADEAEPDNGCHVCGEPAHHFNTFTGGRFCRECFGLITLAAGGAIEVAASGQQVCGRCRDTVYMYSVEAGQWLCRRHFDEVANAS